MFVQGAISKGFSSTSLGTTRPKLLTMGPCCGPLPISWALNWVSRGMQLVCKDPTRDPELMIPQRQPKNYKNLSLKAGTHRAQYPLKLRKRASVVKGSPRI